MKIITTSWDDGHPLDFKLAELLIKYNLNGTFYIPKTNDEHEVMSEKQVQLLSQHFEIGGHTLSHKRLGKLNDEQLRYEIQGCFTWLHDIVGHSPTSFCFPGGVYNNDSVKQALAAGFKILRTTELLSTRQAKVYLIPTTFQIYEHQKFTYIKHLVKRAKLKQMFVWLRSYGETELLKLTDNYLNQVYKKGGYFHIWGHSWEIEQYELWEKLELVFQRISNLPDFIYLSNQSLAVEND